MRAVLNRSLQTLAPLRRHRVTRYLWAALAYALIALEGPRGGHAVAAWIGARGEDACFFDPNFGEYWFENKQDFFKFLRLFAQNLYNARMGLDRYKIQPLARRVRRNW